MIDDLEPQPSPDTELHPTADTTLSSYRSIPVHQIYPSTHQARKLFDEDSLLGLAESLKQEGLLQAITVRPLPLLAGERKKHGFELISGERRWRAAKMLGWKSIEAKVIHVISEGEAAAKSLLENLQRQDLNPMEEAEGFYQLNKVDPVYWTQERIAIVSGKSRPYVTQSLALLNLAESIQEDVRRRTYSRGHALELARLPSMHLQLEVAREIPGRLTREKTRQLVDSILEQRSRLKRKQPLKNADTTTFSKDDLLVDLWPEFVKNPWITSPGNFQVRFLGDWQWSFEIKGPSLDADDRLSVSDVRSRLREELGQILIRMGRSLSFDTRSPLSDAMQENREKSEPPAVS